jgi:N-glycosylase/DNA lyase
LKQDSTHLHYRTVRPKIAHPSPPNGPVLPSGSGKDLEDDDTELLLRQYLNLAPNLTALYEHWSSRDPNFKKRAQKFTGIRILKQDAWEALIGFICSSNNNIARISQMVWTPHFFAVTLLMTM